jgi:hypothetical protein
MGYLEMHLDSLADEEDEVSKSTEAAGIGPGLTAAQEETNIAELEFGLQENSPVNIRDRAGRFLRRLINTGWLGEETLADFTRVINITAWAKPFFESLMRVDNGLKTEYESHVVNCIPLSAARR